MGGNQGGRGQQRGTSYKGTVRWESAQPVLDALKTPLPDAFANHYVIAVIGFPLPAPSAATRTSRETILRGSRRMTILRGDRRMTPSTT